MKQNESIKCVEWMLENNRFDKSQLLNILETYYSEPAIVPFELSMKQKIIRSRIVENYSLFTNYSDLIYPPANCARTDRTSVKSKPMFYASIISNYSVLSPHLVSMYETASILQKYEQEGQVVLTSSLWTPKRKLKVFAFPFTNSYQCPCNDIVNIQKQWSIINRGFSQESIILSEYFGHIVALKNYSCLYDITSTITDYILNTSKYSDCFDGIVYPSVQIGGAGLNICLKPTIVDNDLKFVMSVVELLEIGTNKEATIYPLFETKTPIKTKLEWQLDRRLSTLFKHSLNGNHEEILNSLG